MNVHSHKQAYALNIKEFQTPSNIPIWLVKDKTTPIIHVHFSWQAGSAYEPAQKNGITSLLTDLLTEGAGDLDAQAYQTALEERAIRLGFGNGKDYIYGSLKTLSRNKEKAFNLLHLALNSPRFDKEAIDRTKLSLISDLKSSEQNPSSVSLDQLFHIYFADHPYAQHPNGTIKSLESLTKNDLTTHFKRIRNRKNLRVVVVGDIDENTLTEYIENIFSSWVQNETLTPIHHFKQTQTPYYTLEKRDIPQTVISFAKPGIERSHKDYAIYQVMNYIFSDGHFSSRLLSEIREKQGLTYSIISTNQYYNHAALYFGKLSTQNETTGKLIKELKKQFRLMAEKGVTQDELKEAKTYLVGSYLLNFSSGSSIASQLLSIYNANLGKDYVYKRQNDISSVTLEQVNAMAKNLLDDDALFFSFVGNPNVEELEAILGHSN